VIVSLSVFQCFSVSVFQLSEFQKSGFFTQSVSLPDFVAAWPHPAVSLIPPTAPAIKEIISLPEFSCYLPGFSFCLPERSLSLTKETVHSIESIVPAVEETNSLPRFSVQLPERFLHLTHKTAD
jgi:hypothetical protein